MILRNALLRTTFFAWGIVSGCANTSAQKMHGHESRKQVYSPEDYSVYLEAQIIARLSELRTYVKSIELRCDMDVESRIKFTTNYVDRIEANGKLQIYLRDIESAISVLRNLDSALQDWKNGK